MNIRTSFLSFLLTLSIAPAALFAADVAKADAAFVKTAAGDGLAEVKLGELAKQKGEAPAIKEFGDGMVKDHSKANAELTTIAKSKAIEVPTSVPDKHQATVDKLSKLSGAEFDKAYAAAMVKDHEKAVREFEKASKSATDPEIKAFAAKTLPTLQHHLEMARALPGGHESKKR